MAQATPDVFTIADDILDAVTSRDDTGWALPARRYVSPGALPAFDCEQVTVTIERVYGYEGDPTVELPSPIVPHVGWALRGLVVAITIVRCIHVADSRGTPPTAAELAEDARVLLYDFQRTNDAVKEAVAAGEISGGCRSMAFLEWLPAENSGAMGAGTYRFRLGLGV